MQRGNFARLYPGDVILGRDSRLGQLRPCFAGGRTLESPASSAARHRALAVSRTA